MPDGFKFAILALDTSSLPGSRDGEVALSEDVRVLFQPPIPMPDRWKEWLGSLRAEEFQRSNLVAIAYQQSQKPGVVDDQTNQLEMTVKAVFLGLLLQGSPFGFRGGILLSGELHGSELEIRRVTNVDPVVAVAGSKPFLLLDSMIQDAGEVASVIRDRVMAGGFRRLRDGFASWHGAKLEIFPSERLHGFVRSLDGVMILQRGEGKRMFRQRGQVLLSPTAANDELLGELYDLRSSTSHLNDFEEILSPYPEKGHNVTALLRSFQAELLATEVYRRLLSSRELLDRMKDDPSILGLWDLDETELRRLWGSPIDLESACRQRFTDVTTRQAPEPRLDHERERRFRGRHVGA